MPEHNIGDVIVIDVDGKQTPTMVLAIDEHGALDLRVFGRTAAEDVVRQFVDETGEPFEYPQPDAAGAQLAAVPTAGASDASYQEFLAWQASRSGQEPTPPAEQATPGTV